MQKYVIIILILICFSLFGLYQHEKSLKKDIEFESTPLPTNVQTQVVVEDHKVKVKNKKVAKDGTIKTTVEMVEIIPESKVTVELKDDNSIKIKQPKLGLCLKPGIGVFYAENAGIGISTRFAYFYQFGAFVGIGIDYDKCFNINLGADYRLTKLGMQNVAVGVALNNRNIVSGTINIYFD